MSKLRLFFRGGFSFLIALALVMAPLMEAAQARELGGGGGRGRGDFARNGPAAGGGFAAQRPVQRPAQRPVSKPGPAAQAGRTERTEIRQENRTERTEIRQDGRTERNADRAQAAQNIANNWDGRHYHHYYNNSHDDEWKGVVAGLVIGATVGYIAGAASRPVTTTYVATLPCTPVAIVSAGVRYYACDNVWYNRYYVDGYVRYVVVATPPGY